MQPRTELVVLLTFQLNFFNRSDPQYLFEREKTRKKSSILVTNRSTVVTIRGLKATEEGKPASVKVSFKVKKTGKASKYSYVSKVNVIDEKSAFGITSVTASKVNELQVAFASPVDITKTTLAVTKNSAAVETTKVDFTTDGTSATITTTAKMTKGTYTVTATEGDNKAEGSVVVEDQKVEKIVILNKVALTGDRTTNFSIGSPYGSANPLKAGQAYIYYDVLDQYGESLKASTSIDWTTSCGDPAGKDRTLGCLTVQRSDEKAFTYGEKIYVTGVYSKTGVTISEELTVGAEQALNNVVLEGFIKTGSSEIVHSLPAGFKDKEYQLLYNVTDQNGNEMKAADYLVSGSNTVTFVSNKVLVIKAIESASTANVTIGGKEYCVANIVPGINVNEGGEVTIDAIATKTGNKASLTVIVGDGQILKSFELGAPTGVIADGETVEIPFTATAQDGSEIKSFVTLASQTDFSNLTLNASEGTLKLEEKADGTAKLTWADSKTGWNTDSADGISRPISLTSVVVGGSTSNEMIYVEDKARPDAIASVDMDKAYVEGAAETISLSSFDFLDQYGRNMTKLELKGQKTNAAGTVTYPNQDANKDNKNKGQIYDNGFFNHAQRTSRLSGNEFSDYVFGVKVEYKGDIANVNMVSNNMGAFSNNEAFIKIQSDDTVAAGMPSFTMTTGLNRTVAATGEQTLKFTVAKFKTDVEEISTANNASFRIVDVSQVSGFEVDTADKFFVETIHSGKATGDEASLDKSNIANTVTTASNTGLVKTDSDYQKEVKVNGTFNGSKVSVPAMYCVVTAGKLTVDNEVINWNRTKNVVNGVSASALKWSDLYDATSARYVRKDADDTIKVTVYATTGGALAADSPVIDTATKKVKISDAMPYAAEILAVDKVTVAPTQTTMVLLANTPSVDLTKGLMKEAKADGKDNVIVKDQYGVDITEAAGTTITAKVSGIKENAERYVLNNAKVNKNDTEDANLTGVELGDTMTVTLYAKYGNNTVSKEIALTVGADKNANITGSTNIYKIKLVNGTVVNGTATETTYLQKQLEDVLSGN